MRFFKGVSAEPVFAGQELKKISHLSGDHNLLSKSNIDKNIIKEAFKSCNHPNRVTLKTEFGSSPIKLVSK
jgi:hypothetical protein